MAVYIKSKGVVFPEKNELNNVFKCAKPDIKEFIDPKESRRLSNIIKIGIFAGMTALKNGGIIRPDAIVTGTGLGCLTDTIKFIASIKQYNEENLNPAPFIYSTHNTVGGTISILTGCTGYNSTFVHRGISFESALFESFLMLHEKNNQFILVGGFDELTEEYLKVGERIGLYKEHSVAGEGAGFFVLTDKKEDVVAEIADIKLLPLFDKIKVKNSFMQFIKKNNINISDTVLFAPFNGDSKCDSWKKDFLNSYNWKKIVNPKEISGEFMTAGALSTALAIEQLICDDKIKTVLIWNSFLNMENAFILLKNV